MRDENIIYLVAITNHAWYSGSIDRIISWEEDFENAKQVANDNRESVDYMNSVVVCKIEKDRYCFSQNTFVYALSYRKDIK